MYSNRGQYTASVTMFLRQEQHIQITPFGGLFRISTKVVLHSDNNNTDTDYAKEISSRVYFTNRRSTSENTTLVPCHRFGECFPVIFRSESGAILGLNGGEWFFDIWVSKWQLSCFCLGMKGSCKGNFFLIIFFLNLVSEKLNLLFLEFCTFSSHGKWNW